jgi:hypothetical protein
MGWGSLSEICQIGWYRGKINSRPFEGREFLIIYTVLDAMQPGGYGKTPGLFSSYAWNLDKCWIDVRRMKALGNQV